MKFLSSNTVVLIMIPDTGSSEEIEEDVIEPGKFVQFDQNTGEIISSTSEGIPAKTEQHHYTDSWKITSLYMYTIDGMPIFAANFSSEIDDLDSSVVMQFYLTVQKFAETNLDTRLVDFKVANERIYFKVSTGNIFVITTVLGDEARSGLSSQIYVQLSALITDLSSILFFEGSQEDNFRLRDIIVEMIRDVNNNASIERGEHIYLDELSIAYAVITDSTGMPIVSRSYEGSNFKDDPMLLSMFLHALNVFFNTNFSEDLNEINFGNSRLYIQNHRSHFYAILIQFDDFINLREDSPVHHLSFDILDQMVSMVEELDDDIEFLSEKNLELLVDNFIFKAKYRLNEKMKVEFDSLD